MRRWHLYNNKFESRNIINSAESSSCLFHLVQPPQLCSLLEDMFVLNLRQGMIDRSVSWDTANTTGSGSKGLRFVLVAC